MNHNVGVIGCGKIFIRHLEAINSNKQFNLISICDLDNAKLKKYEGFSTYKDYKIMIEKEDLDFIVIATPNSLHYEQSIYCLKNDCNLLIEKPTTLEPDLTNKIITEAEKNNKKAYCVLQVRLNPCIQGLKRLINEKKIGQIRSISLVQRWQRPEEYFHDWRGKPRIGGGILHECGIHYLDILCYLFGKPNVLYAKQFNTKHKNTSIEDTIYSIFDYKDFGGTIEVNISSEPRNLECSLSIMTDQGFIKLGGKAMNIVEQVSFIDEMKEKYIIELLNSNTISQPNSYGSYSGSCPNHPELYNNLELFHLRETLEVLHLIKEIYGKCGVYYGEEQ
jgi:UDP-N-acetyl-2-amino-2-deoxyglucuronate dehydrogenase